MYTYYQATEKQRSMERDIRALKREALAERAMGNSSAVAAAKRQLGEKLIQYKNFSKAAKLREKLENTVVFGYDKNAAGMIQRTYNQWLHESYGGYLGTFTKGRTLSKYREIIKVGESQLLEGFIKAVDKGDISVLVGIDTYIATAREIEQKLVGVTAADGTKITGYVTHFIDRVIGQSSTPHPGMRTGVSVDDVFDTLLHGTLGKRKESDRGQISRQIVGMGAEVTVNPITGTLIQTNPKGR